MICSKEGNFTSLQVLMIFYSLCSTLGDRKCSFETRPPTRKPENHARHEAACSNSTPLLEIDLYSVSTFYNCLIEGISLCFTLSSNQIKSERSHSLSRIGWSRPWLRLWGFEPLNYLTNDFLNPVKMKRHYLRLNLTAPTERSALNFTLRLSKTPKKYCR